MKTFAKRFLVYGGCISPLVLILIVVISIPKPNGYSEASVVVDGVYRCQYRSATTYAIFYPNGGLCVFDDTTSTAFMGSWVGFPLDSKDGKHASVEINASHKLFHRRDLIMESNGNKVRFYISEQSETDTGAYAEKVADLPKP
jgi:hypothetical protein